MSFTDSLFFILFVSGLTGGFGHCVGMCGPVVVSLSFAAEENKRMAALFFYHTGRITTYVLLGGLMGLMGSFTRISAKIEPFQKSVMILTGVMIILMGIIQGKWVPVRLFDEHYGNSAGIISRVLSYVGKERSTGSFFPLGLVLGFLPCGIVYTALITVARAGMESSHTALGLLTGIGLMASFGIGTVPSLYVVSKVADLGLVKSREAMTRAASLLMIVVGVVFVLKGIRF